MSESKPDQFWNITKLAGIAAISLVANHLLYNHFTPNNKKKENHKNLQKKHSLTSMHQLIEENDQKSDLVEKQDEASRRQLWGSLKLKNLNKQDGLLQQLEIMSKIMCPFQRVSNLIVDYQLNDVITVACPIVATQIKRIKGQAFLMPQSLVKPGEFVIQNCVFRAGQSVQNQKKFMRAGPRSTQYFDPKLVRADIVCSGRATPGINNIIRQLVSILKETYKVEKVTGVRFSYRGYYYNDMIDLTPEIVQKIHHRGGSFLGLASTPCKAGQIVDSLQNRGVNQLYLIGGNDTVKYAEIIYKQIKRRRLNIALCVNLKAINKDIAYFDTCYGFESAVEETGRFIEEGYALSKSNYNSAVFVKVPGRYSGFLAMDSVRAERNAHVCLVPQFGYDLYGENGLLNYIAARIEAKGHCIIVYSEGASYAARDIPQQIYQDILTRKNTVEDNAYDQFLKKELQKVLEEKNLVPNSIFLFDAQNAVRTVPANAFDTKLCCQVALCSIQGLMCGYTNFAIGHFKSRVAMVPLELMACGEKYCLKIEDENWQRLLATTNQPSFSSNHHPH